MWARLLKLIPIGCRHRHTSVPFSAISSGRKSSSQGEWESVSEQSSQPYVVCLDCGKHFEYDWSRMRVVK